MKGYLLGLATNKVVLVTIDFNEKKSNINKDTLDKSNASYICGTYKITEIVDEYLNNYISVDLHIILNEKFTEVQNLKINEEYRQKTVFFYLNKERALQNIYLLNSKSTGIFKQYLFNGQINGEISLKNGKLSGINKIYKNGILVKETEYKNNQENGLSKKYDTDGNILEITNWKNGVLIKNIS